jgi:hypothetical protein
MMPEPSARWSQHVTETSNALDLEPGVFTLDDPRLIASSLKRSAEQSRRRKADPFRSAMSMLNFYINRAGKHLPNERRACLEQAKEELRALFGRPRRGVSKPSETTNGSLAPAACKGDDSKGATKSSRG